MHRSWKLATVALGPRCIAKIFGVLVVWGLACPSWAQFVVQPMKLELTLRAGSVNRQYEGAELILENNDRTQTQYVKLHVVDLTQGENGAWLPIEPNDLEQLDEEQAIRILQGSCRGWITPVRGVDQPVIIRPLGRERIPVNVIVPAGVRGFYCAGVVAALQPRQGVEGVEVVYQFIVPVLIRIEGSTAYPQVQLTDVGLELRPGSEDVPTSTFVTLGVENNGKTYSHIVPKAQLLVYVGDALRVVVRDVEFRPAEYDIIPGARFVLKTDIGRALPAGRYVVRGGLFVDGRRVRGVDKEIAFAGDPAVKRLATDAAVAVSPATIVLDAKPGGMKTSVIEIRNGSPEPIAVRAHVLTPAEMASKTWGGRRGDDLSCAQWVEVSPSEFALAGYGTRNVRLICRAPATGMEYRGYYADLDLYASYADGSNAGKTKALICLVNQAAKSNVSVLSPQPLRFEQSGQASKYIVTARFTNVGDEHVNPRGEIQLVAPDRTVVKTGRMTSEAMDRFMLPFENRDFSGELDLTYMKDGYYILRVLLRDVGTGSQRNDLADAVKYVQVYLDQGRRVMEEVPENTFKQEASRVQKTVKWGG